MGCGEKQKMKDNNRKYQKKGNVCPECKRPFKRGLTGIDGHWRSARVGHEDVMPYEDMMELLEAGQYPERP